MGEVKKGHKVGLHIVTTDERDRVISTLEYTTYGWDRQGANATGVGLVDAILRKLAAAAEVDVDELP